MSTFLNKIKKTTAPPKIQTVAEGLKAPPSDFRLPEKVKQIIPAGDSSYFELRRVSVSSILYYENERGQFFKNSPETRWHNANFEKKETLSKTFGSILHKAILEKDEFDSAKETFFSLLGTKEKTILKSCLKNIENHSKIVRFLKGNIKEKTFIFEHKSSQGVIPCKSKIDLINEKNWLVEIKTIDRLDNMKRSFDKYRYDLQLSFYKENLEKNNVDVSGVAIFGVEKTAPFDSHIFIVSKEQLERGKFGDEYVRGWNTIIEEMYFNPEKRFKKYFSFL